MASDQHGDGEPAGYGGNDLSSPDIAASGGLEAIYRASRDELLRFLTARTGNATDAEDILQDLWFRLQQPASGPIQHGRAYLYRMTQNLVVDRLRERQRRDRRERAWMEERAGAMVGADDVADSAATAEDMLIDREEAAMVASAIGNLPTGARRVFQLHKLDGLSHADVARQLGISRSGVEKHMTVAMKYLRRALLD